MNKNFFKILAIVVIASFASCTGYNKALKSDDYNFKYRKAYEFYQDEDYYKAMTLFEDILHIYKGTAKAEDLNYYFANCHYMQNDFILAAHYFEKFAATYPFSDKTEDALYFSSYCYYLTSPRPSLDQTDTKNAIAHFQSYINNYPDSDRLDDVNKYIDELWGKLEEKSYMSAKLYYKLSEYQSASIALKNSLKDFPDSKYREEVMYLSVKSSFLLAEGSIESRKGERYQNTVSEYYTFIDEFPESEYLKEVEKMYAQSVNNIKNL